MPPVAATFDEGIAPSVLAPARARTLALSDLSPGATATVLAVGSRGRLSNPFERRLLELGFIHGERVEVLAEARPGNDPFVVRVGQTMLALRRREAQSIVVEPTDD